MPSRSLLMTLRVGCVCVTYSANFLGTAGRSLGSSCWRYSLFEGGYRASKRQDSTIAKLQEEQVPRMTISHSNGQGRDGVGPHRMWAQIDVQNTSPSLALSSASIHVVEAIHVAEQPEVSGGYVLLDLSYDWSPIEILWASGVSETTIPPGTSRTAIIAYSDDFNGPSGGVFNDGRHTPLVLEQKITVEISSPDSPSLREEYFIRCHPNYLSGPQAHFEFERWDRWSEGHPVIDRRGVFKP